MTDRLRVRLAAVNVDERKIDFVPIEAGNESAADAVTAPRRGRRSSGDRPARGKRRGRGRG